MTSAGFAVALLIFTVITFFDWSDFRHWPASIGLVLSIIITAAAFVRAKAEGVELPKMPQGVSVNRGGDAAAATAAATPPPPAVEQPRAAEPPPTAPAEPSSEA